MKVERGEVEHVALLARLKLSEEEKEVFTSQLNAILDYMEKLNALDTGAIEPTFHVVSHCNIMREDEVRGSLPQEASLENAPDRAEGCFRVPKII
ncbi:MAG: asparaginyl/glutamyl-tRNA amidotransferase subunit C [Deltaproteobacteria bacterium RBG_16_54_11]|jgi:aspartyl-tRNA(Asn)/glutamyl-tRNA(Gln) amidotransferase subunit C|nr:MAG: asparaginyl/glutamyl-tRNA amidotransferase subunit C [Deltaproteobacteria bacterium RBG_16_54_11]